VVEALTRMLWVLLLAFPAAVSAHRLDEYLQATLVAIDPDAIRLQINLTPGVAVADQVLALIDGDRDGGISIKEEVAYAESLKGDLVVKLDQRRLDLHLDASNFPSPAELRSGEGIIRLDFSATAGPVTAGTHEVTLENRHLPDVSVYLVNAALPRVGSVQITRQERNADQSVGEIEFSFSAR
jgi:hypothetical protein